MKVVLNAYSLFSLILRDCRTALVEDRVHLVSSDGTFEIFDDSKSSGVPPGTAGSELGSGVPNLGIQPLVPLPQRPEAVRGRARVVRSEQRLFSCRMLRALVAVHPVVPVGRTHEDATVSEVNLPAPALFGLELITASMPDIDSKVPLACDTAVDSPWLRPTLSDSARVSGSA